MNTTCQHIQKSAFLHSVGLFPYRWATIIIAIILGFLCWQPVSAAQAPVYDLYIEAGAASETLTALAELTKTQLIFPFDQLTGIQTNAVKGRLSFRRALSQMLRQTNLRASYDRGDIVIVYLANGTGGEKGSSATKANVAQASPRLKNAARQRPKQIIAVNADTAIEEISVTARKRSESIRDVPFSIAAQSEATIFLSGAQNLTDFARGVSGLTHTDLGPGQSQIAIRGVSSGQVVRDQPGIKEQVGVYLDETAISMALFTPDLDFFDLNRIEVLRGPQGTLFGSGSLAGTVRYISNPPNMKRHEIIAEASVKATKGGSIGSSFKAAVNIPINQNKAAVRAVGYYNELNGYVNAVGPGGTLIENVNDGNKYGGRLALAFAASDGLRITPRVVFQNLKTNGFPRIDLFNVLANPYTQSRPAVTLAKGEQYIQLRESLDDNFLLFDTVINYDTDTLSLTSVSSLIDRDIKVVRDAGQLTTSILAQPSAFDLSGPVLDRDAPLIDTTSLSLFSQELRVASHSDGPLDYVFGGFFTRSERRFGQTLIVPEFEALTGLSASDDPALSDYLFYSKFDFNFSQWALFGEATYVFTDKLKVTAGLRWFKFMEERTLRLDGLFAAVTEQTAEPAKTVSDGFTPRFILSYDASEGFKVHAQIAKGFRLGGINDPLNAPLCTPEDLETFGDRPFFKNEELWNYEIGLKSTLAGGRLTFDAAVFYADIRNLQANVDAGSCSSRIVFNVPRARSLGIEAEIFLRPHPDLDISFSATMQSAEIRSNLFAGEAGSMNALTGISAGNRLPTSPTFQATSQFSYHWLFSDKWSGFAALSLHYVGSSFTQIGDQVPGFGNIDLTVTQLGDPSISSFQFDPEIPAYQTGSIRFGARRGALELSIYINNFWNENIRTSLDRERGGLARVGHLQGQPRTIGLTLRGNF